MNNMHVKSLVSKTNGVVEDEKFLFDGLICKNDGGASTETVFVKTMSVVKVDVLISLSTSHSKN